MKNGIQRCGLFVFVTGVLSLFWLFYDQYMIWTDMKSVLAVGVRGYSVGAGYLFLLAFHVCAFLYLYMIRHGRKPDAPTGTAALIAGIFSLFSLAIQKVMWDEIGRELGIGGVTAVEALIATVKTMVIIGEMIILGVMMAINALFIILTVVLVVKTPPESTQTLRLGAEENVFTTANIMGIVSGCMGLIQTITLIGKNISLERAWVYIPFYLLFLFPYCLAIIYWISLKFRVSILNWYDEKQMRDMMKSALITLFMSAPGMALLFIVRPSVTIWWLPYYLFLVLTLFSGGTLYFFRRA